MPKTTKAVKKVKKEVEEVPEVVEKVIKSIKKEVSVYDDRGVFVRSYSKDVHGDNFEALASQFVSDKLNYSTK